MERSICFVPLEGLCNRMRAMASGVYIANKLNSSITIYWKKSHECFADFTELFLPIDGQNIKVRPYPWNGFYLAVDRKKNFYIPGIIRRFIFDDQIIGKKECLDERFFEKFRDGKIFMTSCYSLTRYYSLTELFVPVPELSDRINQMKQCFSENVIGIHIRRGDNIHSIRKNDVDDYFSFMDSEIATEPETRFYLATDSVEVKKEMTNRYGDRMLYHDAVLERDSVQGMKDAVVDLWCLGLTKRIIGSYYSSYSEIAAEMGGIELTILE